jgi:hypothetical protein
MMSPDTSPSCSRCSSLRRLDIDSRHKVDGRLWLNRCQAPSDRRAHHRLPRARQGLGGPQSQGPRLFCASPIRRVSLEGNAFRLVSHDTAHSALRVTCPASAGLFLFFHSSQSATAAHDAWAARTCWLRPPQRMRQRRSNAGGDAPRSCGPLSRLTRHNGTGRRPSDGPGAPGGSARVASSY